VWRRVSGGQAPEMHRCTKMPHLPRLRPVQRPRACCPCAATPRDARVHRRGSRVLRCERALRGIRLRLRRPPA
jgi:hypothetical protein